MITSFWLCIRAEGCRGNLIQSDAVETVYNGMESYPRALCLAFMAFKYRNTFVKADNLGVKKGIFIQVHSEMNKYNLSIKKGLDFIMPFTLYVAASNTIYTDTLLSSIRKHDT